MEWASGNTNWATLSTLCLHSMEGESAVFQFLILKGYLVNRKPKKFHFIQKSIIFYTKTVASVRSIKH